jgi:carbamoylphosphate synthase large subunit
MSERKTLVFFGTHIIDWTQALSSANLLPALAEYVDNIIQTDQPENIPKSSYVIPLMEDHMLILHKHSIKAIMPGLTAITSFRNKYLFHKYASEYKLNAYVPELYTSNKDINYPVIVKPINGYASMGISIVETSDKILPEYFDTNKYIVEEYIAHKQEYVSHVVAKEGKIISCFTYCYTYEEEQNIKCINSSSMALIILDPQYVKILTLFLQPCTYSGVCNFNFRLKENNITIFEINPRMGGSLMQKEYKGDLVKIITTLIANFS